MHLLVNELCKSQTVMIIFRLEFNFWKPLNLRLGFRLRGGLLWILGLILEWLLRLKPGFNL